MTRFISQDSVAAAATQIVKTAESSVDITGAWITGSALRILLQSIRTRIEAGDLKLRIVCRLHGLTDLDITDLGAIKEFEQFGAQVRFSRRLHAKMVLVDRKHGIVSSSNLTSTAGYIYNPANVDWTNFEAGVVLEPQDAELVADATAFFERIWEDACPIDQRAVGVVIGEPTTSRLDVVMVRPVKRSQYVVAECDSGPLLGKIEEIRTINVSFPGLERAAGSQNSTGFNREPLPDLRALFTGESKEEGFLKLTTFFDPAAAFNVASVRVLHQRVEGRLKMALVPTAPGAIVQQPTDDWLLSLQGQGEIQIGRALNHETVPVSLRAEELLRRHCAVYGMTGAGKSNGLKVLLRSLLTWLKKEPAEAGRDLRVIVIDTHGEYAVSAANLEPDTRIVDVLVPDAIDLLDEGSVRQGLNLARSDTALKERIWALKEQLEADGTVATCAQIIDALRPGVTRGSTTERLIRTFDRAPERVAIDPQPETIDAASGNPEDFASPGLYILNLSKVHDATTRSVAVGHVIDYVFERAKDSDGVFNSLLVIDEVQNFAPESGLDPVRASLDAILRVAREGRKFGVGLVISSQRPANVNTGLRSQCNTHLIFRLVNNNDLGAIADTVEAADRTLVTSMLPQLDIGTCFASGTAIDSPFFVEVPLFTRPPVVGAGDSGDEVLIGPTSLGPLDGSDRIPAG